MSKLSRTQVLAAISAAGTQLQTVLRPCGAQVAIERMQVKLSKKMFGERVRWAPADDSASLEELVKNLPQSDGEGTQVRNAGGKLSDIEAPDVPKP